ncbi:hypothetical protein LRY65_00830 [Candidatus Woesebacteria bacterium]|nr:hypothetical protein [Candidatus Woesebacteria bacterium]MCD8507674.1 hypothetical protein [Candidatus Woesebacteria bacterium]MCD8526742.1 hypothetical protein [Candidatus Woesebacteria bacterium]MCD8546514.1 hypothetical protein [Candidatus Woesebacteria bacterium]
MGKLLAQNNPFGTITPPAVVENSYGVLGAGAGITGFISRLIILVTIVGGIWALFNILTAGFMVIVSPGDSKQIGEMSQKITNTFIGLLVMVAAPLLAALIGLFFFGDARFLLQPVIEGVGN